MRKKVYVVVDRKTYRLTIEVVREQSGVVNFTIVSSDKVPEKTTSLDIGQEIVPPPLELAETAPYFGATA